MPARISAAATAAKIQSGRPVKGRLVEATVPPRRVVTPSTPPVGFAFDCGRATDSPATPPAGVAGVRADRLTCTPATPLAGVEAAVAAWVAELCVTELCVARLCVEEVTVDDVVVVSSVEPVAVVCVDWTAVPGALQPALNVVWPAASQFCESV